MTLEGHWTMWPEHPLLVPFILAVPLALYLAGWWGAWRAGRREPLRLLAFLAGIDVLMLALGSPLHHVANEYLLSAHMVQHVLVGDVAPLLLVLGLTGPLTAMVPAWLLRLAGPRRLAFLVWTAATAGWYVPALFARALADPWLHATMQATILLAGLMAWAHIAGIAPRRGSAAGRAGFALALLAAGMVVSEWLFLTAPGFDVYIDQPERLLGLSPTADQTKAALIMGSEGMITMLTAAALLMWAHVDRAVTGGDVTESPPCAPPESSP
jgi:cytochrome c oxidase assembly factor CtaG